MPENIYQHPWPVRYPEEYTYTSVGSTVGYPSDSLASCLSYVTRPYMWLIK